jgi:hypothetical protein
MAEVAAKLFAFWLILGGSAIGSLAADRPPTYDEIYERLFPPPRWDLRPKGTILQFCLRFHPGLDPALGTDSQVEVNLISGANPTAEFSSAARRIEEVSHGNPRASLEEMAALLQVKRQMMQVTPAQVFRWQEGLLKALNRTLLAQAAEAKEAFETGTSYVTLDASRYDVWYSDGPVKYEIQGLVQPRFVKWADGLRSEIARGAKRPK